MLTDSANLVLPVQPAKLAKGLALLTIVLLIACVYRLIWLEKHRAGDLRERAFSQQESENTYPARRGAIVDSNPVHPEQHTTLAASYLLDCIGIDPVLVRPGDLEPLVGALAEIFPMGATRRGELLRQLEAAESAKAAGRKVDRDIKVQRLVTPEQSARVRRLRQDRRFAGITINPELKREYPAGQLAAHLIGYVNEWGEPTGGGLEGRFNDRLAGVNGYKKVVADRDRNPIWSSERDYRRPRHGLTLVLNINAVIQATAEQELAEAVKHYQAESGVAVVMDPFTGAVLAMASVPTFKVADFPVTDRERQRNRALTDPFEPGSIFKWVTVAGALEQKAVRMTDTFDAHHGSWTRNGRTISDVSIRHGVVTVRDGLVNSLNIVLAQIGMKMGNQGLRKAVTDFGFGGRTGIELSDVEDDGEVKPLSKWTSYSAPSISFGQEIQVTPIQILRAFCAIANGGYLLQPRLVQAVVDDSAVIAGGTAKVVEDYSQPAGRRILSEATSRALIDALTGVVEEGTGQKAKIAGVKVFGKTGTARIAERGGYSTVHYTSSFIGGAPSESPRLVVLVSIRKPVKSIGYYGGTVAAPAGGRILERSLAFLRAE